MLTKLNKMYETRKKREESTRSTNAPTETGVEIYF